MSNPRFNHAETLVENRAKDAGWMDQAACKDTDLDMWFQPDRAAEALKICGRCPVVDDCLQDGMKRRAADGIVGATKPRERARLARKMRIYGWPEATPSYDEPACVVDGCEDPAKTRAMCQLHYARMRTTGTTDPPVSRAVIADDVQERADEIMDSAAAAFDLTRVEMRDGRSRRHVECRRVAMQEMVLLGLSYAQIGRLMGLHHTTVLHAFQRTRRQAA